MFISLQTEKMQILLLIKNLFQKLIMQIAFLLRLLRLQSLNQ